MVWAATAVAAAGVVGSVLSSNAQKSAASNAADAQNSATDKSIAAQQEANAALQGLLAPYAQAGSGAPSVWNAAQYLKDNPDVAADEGYSKNPYLHWVRYGQAEGRADPGYTVAKSGSLQAQQDLLGLNGNEAQTAAVQGIANSGQFQALAQQGENAMAQNASATGGLRGGNFQGALAQFRPQLLNQLINEQYTKLGGITSIGQNAAAGTGNAGMQTGNNISNLLQQAGAANAGAALASGKADAQMYSGIGSAVGTLGGMYASGAWKGF